MFLASLLLLLPGRASAEDARLRGLCAALADPDLKVRLSAITWLGELAQIDAAVVERWVPVLAEQPGLADLQSRLLAEDVQQQEFYRALLLVPGLVEHLQAGVIRAGREAPITVRPLAIPTLKQLRKPSAETRRALLELLSSTDESTRTAASEVLLILGPHYVAKPDITTAFLKDERARGPVLALLAVGWPAALDDEHVLAQFLQSVDPDVVRSTVRALQHHRNAIPKLQDLGKLIPILQVSKDKGLGRHVVCGLGPFISSDRELAQLVSGCLGSAEDDAGAMLAAITLSRRISPAVRDLLVPVLEGGHAERRGPVRSAAVRALATEQDSKLLPIFLHALRDQDREVVRAALQAIASFGQSARSALAAVLDALRTSEAEAGDFGLTLQAIFPGSELPREFVALMRGGSAIRARNAALADPQLHRRVMPALVELLEAENATVRETAIVLAEGIALPPEQISQIASLLDKPKPPTEALDVLAGQPAAARAHAGRVARLLESDDQVVVRHALSALTALHAVIDHQVIVSKLAQSGDLLVRAAALKALGDAIASNLDSFTAALREHDVTVTSAAMIGLMTQPEAGRRLAAEIAPYLRGDDTDLGHMTATRAIAWLAPLDLPALLQILQLAHKDSSNAPRYRFYALLASGDRADLVWYGRWLGKSQVDAVSLSPLERRAALQRLHAALPLTRETELRTEIGDRVDLLVAAGSFRADDIELLSALRQGLEQMQHSAAQRLSRVLLSLQIFRYGKYTACFLAAHVLVWLLLLLLYPRSKVVQAWFFWHPWVRKLGGLGYVHLVAGRISLVRNRLLAPFKQNFTEDAIAAVDGASEGNYFSGSFVEYADPETHGASKLRARITEAITGIRGRIVLEGESGLGKSVFLRRLVWNATRPTVYLPAERCAGGVLGAVQQKLHGFARDESFLQTLVYTGGLDLCIDGLNEVTPETRAEITQFVLRHPHANVLLATQPLLDWRPPGCMYRLLPLGAPQTLEFLGSRYPDSEPDAISANDYDAFCKAFLAKALDPAQDAGLLASVQMVLSNPMDLTIVAQMLLARKQPDLLRLQEQQFLLAALRYRRVAFHEFPLEQFSERIYQMRLRGDSELPAEISQVELDALVGPKMIFSRDARDGKRRWFFRHDKIMEFFVLQAFLLEGSDRPERHLDDPRFRGVYFLMAMRLPLNAATLLRDQLVVRAARTNDHTVSDRFVQLLESRKVANLEGPKWLDRYELPYESSAKQMLAELEQASDSAQSKAHAARTRVVNWFDCRSALAESTEDRLLDKAAKLVESLGAVRLLRTADASLCRFEAPSGEAFVLIAATSAEMLTSADIEDARQLAALAFEIGGTKPLLVVNVMPSTDPVQRHVWLSPDAEAKVVEHHMVCVTTLSLLEVLAELQLDRCTPNALWASLHNTNGFWRYVAPVLLREAR
ncbi:MAG TPA: HEAT repeat domain-containing protein [Kofleriaceae bacterium]